MNTSQLLHISGEIVVLLSFTYFLQRQITKLAKAHAELNKRIEELEQDYKKKFDMLFNVVENLDRQLHYTQINTPINSVNPFINMGPSQNNTGIRNRKAKQSSNENVSTHNESTQPKQRNTDNNINHNNVQQPAQQMPQMSQMPQMPNFGFNPLDLLNSLSGMQTPPVFTATIVTENIIPKKPENETKIVEVVDDEEDEEKIDEEIADELNDLLTASNQSEQSQELEDTDEKNE